ncbi:hypothetical protein [Sphingobium yanoikuyae]|uniref:hypothetical protein n=1 Tax=Sphingobium yanoikuyae TaxID=13690 RepID=UPI002FDD9FBC
MTQAQLDSRSKMPPWRPIMWSIVAVLLLAPAAAMQFTREVTWTRFDFAAAAILLVGAGAVFEIVARHTSTARHRTLIGAAILGLVRLTWIEGAVGLFH